MSVRLPRVTLRIVEAANLRAAAKSIRDQGQTVEAPTSLMEAVERRLRGPSSMNDQWSRNELQAVCLLLTNEELRGASLGVLAANVRKLRTSGLAYAIGQKPQVSTLRYEAARRSRLGQLRGPRWLRCQTPATLSTDDSLLAHLSAQLHWKTRAVPDLLSAIELSAAVPLGRRVLLNGLRDQGSQVLWPHVNENLSWALETVEDHSLARNMVDVILRLAGNYQAGDGPIRKAALEGLRDRYGGWADTPARRERWGRHRQATQDLEKRFRVARQLEHFFAELHGDPDRLRYWRRWIDHIDDADIYERIHAFSMRIGPYVFVEFGKVGNALYVYHAADWSRLSPRGARVPADIKNKDTAVFRLGHKGAWQPKADQQVTALTLKHPKP